MATTGTVLSKNMKMYAGATAYTCQVDASISGQTNMFETTCKDSAADSSFLPGSKSWTAAVKINGAFDATLGMWTSTTGIFDKWDDQATVSLVFQTGVTGDQKLSGTAYVSNWTADASGNDNAVTIDVQFQGTGALVMATI